MLILQNDFNPKWLYINSPIDDDLKYLSDQQLIEDWNNYGKNDGNFGFKIANIFF